MIYEAERDYMSNAKYDRDRVSQHFTPTSSQRERMHKQARATYYHCCLRIIARRDDNAQTASSD